MTVEDGPVSMKPSVEDCCELASLAGLHQPGYARQVARPLGLQFHLQVVDQQRLPLKDRLRVAASEHLGDTTSRAADLS